MGQAFVTNWGSFLLLQIRANIVINWDSNYKLGQPLLQNRSAITNWGKIHHKLGQVLKIRAIITYWRIYIHKKTPLLESRFNKETPTEVFFCEY